MFTFQRKQFNLLAYILSMSAINMADVTHMVEGVEGVEGVNGVVTEEKKVLKHKPELPKEVMQVNPLTKEMIAIYRGMLNADPNMLFSHQKKFIDYIKENFDEEFMVYYNATFGSGKTFSLLPLAKLLLDKRTEAIAATYTKGLTLATKLALKKTINTRILFVCPQKQVNMDLAKLFYQLSQMDTTGARLANFGFADVYKNEVVVNYNTHLVKDMLDKESDALRRLDKSYKQSTMPGILISSVDAARRLLADSDSDTEFIVFFDEFMKGSDTMSSEFMSSMNLLKELEGINRVILSSASSLDKLVLDKISEGKDRKDIDAMNFNVPWKLFHNEKEWHVFNGLETKEQSAKLRHMIENDVSTLRMVDSSTITRLMWFTPNIVLEDDLVEEQVEQVKLAKEEAKDVKKSSGGKKGANPRKAKAAEDREKAIIAKTDKEQAKKSHADAKVKKNKKILDDVSILLNALEQTENEYIKDLCKFQTEQTEIPSHSIFKKMLDTAIGTTIVATPNAYRACSGKFGAQLDSLRQILSKYQIDLESLDKIPSHVEKKIQELSVTGRIYTANIDLFDMDFEDDLLLLYILGISVYSKEVNEKYPEYARIVAFLAKKGIAPLLYADAEIAHGVNFAVSQIFVSEQFVEAHSLSTILQLLGRAGRTGLSDVANINCPQILIELLQQRCKEESQCVDIDSYNVAQALGYRVCTEVPNAVDNIKKMLAERKASLRKEKKAKK